MPAYLTHRAAGERVFEKLTGAAIPHRAAYYLGCQGPDMLFFSKPWHPIKGGLLLGVTMHSSKTRELLSHAMEFLQSYDKEDRDELVSYMAGFLTHYSLDKNAHPFVYDKAGLNPDIHHAMEFMWDSYMALEQWGMEPQEFDIYSEVLYGSLGNGICEWYSKAAKSVYGKELSPEAVREAQLRLAKVKRMFSNITLPGRMLLQFLSELISYDLSAMIYPKRRDESLFTGEEYAGMQGMITKGVSESCEMIDFMLDFVNGSGTMLPDWFGEKNFAGELIG